MRRAEVCDKVSLIPLILAFSVQQSVPCEMKRKVMGPRGALRVQGEGGSRYSYSLSPLIQASFGAALLLREARVKGMALHEDCVWIRSAGQEGLCVPGNPAGLHRN